jgi:hypothetical protein
MNILSSLEIRDDASSARSEFWGKFILTSEGEHGVRPYITHSTVEAIPVIALARTSTEPKQNLAPAPDNHLPDRFKPVYPQAQTNKLKHSP